MTTRICVECKEKMQWSGEGEEGYDYVRCSYCNRYLCSGCCVVWHNCEKE